MDILAKERKVKDHLMWLSKYFPLFLSELGVSPLMAEFLMNSYVDKCYSYEYIWHKAEIPIERAMALFLLAYTDEYKNKVGWVEGGDFIPIDVWVIDQYIWAKHTFDKIDGYIDDMVFDLTYYNGEQSEPYISYYVSRNDNPINMNEVFAKFLTRYPDGYIIVKRSWY